MAYNAYIVKVKELRPHPNADRLQIATVFGNDVCVGLDISIGDIQIYFPSDGQLSEEYCEFNNLVRKKDEAGNNIGGYMDPDKRNVTAIRLRGERSDGLLMPLKSLEFTGIDLSEFNEGDLISVVNGKEICKKYIPKRNKVSSTSTGNRTRKKKVPVAPLFCEHADTEQLAYNLSAFRPGDQIEITLKMHGTSQRTGYLPVLKGYKQDFWGRLLRCINADKKMKPFVAKLYDQAIRNATPIYDWGYVSGTRRTVLEDYTGGYYGSNEFRETHSKTFEGKLLKGETVYYEVVGFTQTGVPIMGNGKNEKLGKDFVKQYGKETVFSYGCVPDPEDWVPHDHCELEPQKPQSDIYVYRMTMTNEDGDVIEYTPEYMRYRCEQMGVKTVPVFAKATIDCEGVHVYSPNEELYGFIHETENVGETVREIAEKYYDGTDPIGKTHIREGVVVRIINRPKFTAYKHKSFEFKVLSGIMVDNANPDEVSEDILSEM